MLLLDLCNICQYMQYDRCFAYQSVPKVNKYEKKTQAWNGENSSLLWNLAKKWRPCVWVQWTKREWEFVVVTIAEKTACLKSKGFLIDHHCLSKIMAMNTNTIYLVILGVEFGDHRDPKILHNSEAGTDVPYFAGSWHSHTRTLDIPFLVINLVPPKSLWIETSKQSLM